MYIISWYNSSNEMMETVGNYKSIIALVNMFENSKIKFKISNRMGPLDQSVFGCSGYNYWIKV